MRLLSLKNMKKRKKSKGKEKCKQSLKWTINDLQTKNHGCDPLREELQIHGLKKSGKKSDSHGRLIKHYKECHWFFGHSLAF